MYNPAKVRNGRQLGCFGLFLRKLPRNSSMDAVHQSIRSAAGMSWRLKQHSSLCVYFAIQFSRSFYKHSSCLWLCGYSHYNTSCLMCHYFFRCCTYIINLSFWRNLFVYFSAIITEKPHKPKRQNEKRRLTSWRTRTSWRFTTAATSAP